MAKCSLFPISIQPTVLNISTSGFRVMNKGMEEETQHVLETEQVVIKDEAIESLYLNEIKSEPQDNFDYESNGEFEAYESISIDPLPACKSESEDSDGFTNHNQILVHDSHIFHLQENTVHETRSPAPFSSKGEFRDSGSTPENYCHECKKQFRRHSALVSHMKMHFLDDDDDDDEDGGDSDGKNYGSDDQQFKSDIGSKKIKTKNGLDKHRDNHFKRIFECEFCNFKTHNFYENYMHKQNHSKSDRLYKCHLCNYNTICENERNEHLKMHELSGHKRLYLNKEQGILYRCCVCNYQTQDINAKNDHLKEHSSKGKEVAVTIYKTKTLNTVLQCGICFQKFSKVEHFFAHRKIHSELECKECGQLLSKKSHMMFHKLSHVGKFSNICRVCGSEFSMHSMLEVHESIHNKKVNCKCNVCGKEFVLPSQMFAHQKVHCMGRNVLHEAANVKLHYAKEGYLCRQCGKNHEDIMEYAKHMVIHWKSTEYRLKCSVCEDVFETAGQLVIHRKTHPQMMAA